MYETEIFPPPKHIQSVAEDAAQMHRDVLGEELDTEAYLHEIHSDLLEIAQQELSLSLKDMDALAEESGLALFAGLQAKERMDAVEQKYRQAELILARAGLSDEDTAAAHRRINAFYAQNILSYLNVPLKTADISEFESRANNLARALDATGAEPAQRAVIIRDVALKRLDCYKNLFNLFVDLFAGEQISISQLESAVVTNNQVVDEVASALKQCSIDEGTYGPAEKDKIETLRMQYTMHVHPNSYRTEIKRLLGGLNNQDNGHPRATKKKIANTIRRVNDLITKAEMDRDQYFELRGMIKTIKKDSGYWSEPKPEQPWKKNGRDNYQNKGQHFDRRMRNFSKKHR
jgi:hypothetical protein